MASSNRYTAGQDSVCTACKITFFFFFFPSDDGLCGPIVVETCYLDLQQGPSSPDVNFNTFFFSFSFFLLGRRRRRRMTWVNINSAPLHRLVRSLEIDTSRVVFFFRRVAAVVDTRPRWKKRKKKRIDAKVLRASFSPCWSNQTETQTFSASAQKFFDSKIPVNGYQSMVTCIYMEKV